MLGFFLWLRRLRNEIKLNKSNLFYLYLLKTFSSISSFIYCTPRWTNNKEQKTSNDWFDFQFQFCFRFRNSASKALNIYLPSRFLVWSALFLCIHIYYNRLFSLVLWYRLWVVDGFAVPCLSFPTAATRDVQRLWQIWKIIISKSEKLLERLSIC